MLKRRFIVFVAVMIMALLVGLSIADDERSRAKDEGGGDKAASVDKQGHVEGSSEKAEGVEKGDDDRDGQMRAEEVLEELLTKRSENPLIEPAVVGGGGGAMVGKKVGTSPNVKKQKLRREGTFVIKRRGRLARAGGGTNWMFVFESDKGLEDPPMYLMPCRKLEVMEGIFNKQGDAAVFVVTGQVFVYHQANYLMPTVVMQAAHRGNIEP